MLKPSRRPVREGIHFWARRWWVMRSNVEFDTQRQRALADRVGPAIQVPATNNETARLRSVKAQVKEKTNVDLRDDVVLAWLRRREP